MNPNTRTRLVSSLGIIAIVAGLGYFGYRTVTGFDLPGRLSDRDSRGIEAQSEPRVGLSYNSADLKGFDSIEVDGSWKLTIAQGEFGVDLTVPQSLEDDVTARVRGDALELDVRSGLRAITGNLQARISLPELDSISINGSADVRIQGVDAERLRLDADGAANIVAVDSRIARLDVDVDGAANIDFSDSLVVDADVQIDGAGSLDITMDGGRLDGELSGVGNVTYGGSVSSQSIDIDGLGSVRER